jgi:tryptophan synthase beta chain
MAGYTFNKFNADRTLDLVQALDVHYLCIKNFHLPFDATPAQIAEFKKKCADHDITGYGVGPIYMASNEEAKKAFDKLGVKPDVIIGCAGGGSNLGGLIAPFMGEKLRGEADYRIIAVEPASCPSFTRGRYAYDFCDTGKVCPLQKMYTLGHDFIPSASHAGGLRYHGMSATLSELYDQKMMEARAVEQTSVFAAAEQFARVEGILPAPESSHAIRVAIDEALRCKAEGKEETILFGLTGTGYFDMVAYEKFNDGSMCDYLPTDADLAASFAKLPKV